MVTIDPGVHGSGFALWEDAKLINVHYDEHGGDYWFIPSAEPMLIELPQVYSGSKSKGNPNNLIQLAFAAGRIAGSRSRVTTVLPRQWKGTIKKEVMLRRIVSKLTDDELFMLKRLKLPKSQEKECVDAIGIGLWRLGRL